MGTLDPQTELDAVNEMLQAAGESPVGSLTDDVAEAGDALERLRKESLRVQSAGWYFNTIYGRKITPNGSDEILLPSNTIDVTVWYTDQDEPYEMRTVSGTKKMYDVVDETYEFDDPVYVRLVLFMDFDELPEVAKSYITIRAARRYQDIAFGDDKVNAFLRNDETMAYAALKNAHSRHTRRTAMDNRSHLNPVSAKWRRGH